MIGINFHAQYRRDFSYQFVHLWCCWRVCAYCLISWIVSWERSGTSSVFSIPRASRWASRQRVSRFFISLHDPVHWVGRSRCQEFPWAGIVGGGSDLGLHEGTGNLFHDPKLLHPGWHPVRCLGTASDAFIFDQLEGFEISSSRIGFRRGRQIKGRLHDGIDALRQADIVKAWAAALATTKPIGSPRPISSPAKMINRRMIKRGSSPA